MYERCQNKNVTSRKNNNNQRMILNQLACALATCVRLNPPRFDKPFHFGDLLIPHDYLLLFITILWVMILFEHLFDCSQLIRCNFIASCSFLFPPKQITKCQRTKAIWLDAFEPITRGRNYLVIWIIFSFLWNFAPSNDCLHTIFSKRKMPICFILSFFIYVY